MNGQIAAISTLTLGVVAAVAVVSWVIGIIDIVRLPKWAWMRAERSRVGCLLLVILIPIFGFLIYVFFLEHNVAAIAKTGKAASMSFDAVGTARTGAGQPERGYGTVSPPVGFGSFGAASPPVGYSAFGGASPPVGYGSFGAASPPVGSRGTVPQIHQQPVTVTKVFKPSMPDPSLTIAAPPKPEIPAGWKSDETGRHQFRYWDGFHWTENVADEGVQSIDPV